MLGRTAEALEAQPRGRRPGPRARRRLLDHVRAGDRVDPRQILHDVDGTRTLADQVLQLKAEATLGAWVSFADAIRAWTMAELASYDEGLDLLRQALIELQAAGMGMFMPWTFSSVPDLCVRAGRVDRGSSVLGRGDGVIAAQRARWWEAELMRQRAGARACDGRGRGGRAAAARGPRAGARAGGPRARAARRAQPNAACSPRPTRARHLAYCTTTWSDRSTTCCWRPSRPQAPAGEGRGPGGAMVTAPCGRSLPSSAPDPRCCSPAASWSTCAAGHRAAGLVPGAGGPERRPRRSRARRQAAWQPAPEQRALARSYATSTARPPARPRRSKEVIKASRATFEDGKLEAGVVADLRKLPTRTR